MKTRVPVLFLVFNRPETTQQVFQKIREVRPPRLYVAADGPRNEHSGEKLICEKVRAIATNIDWECDVRTLFRDENLGCRIAVSTAINWFFDNEEMGIILEDDCLPDISFFHFSEKLLYRYSDNDQIMSISGNNFQPRQRTDNSYYFSKYMHCWGWAGWRRGWKHFEPDMRSWPALKMKNFLTELFESPKAQYYWKNIFELVYDGKIDSWAYIWQYSIWVKKGINILPEVNLVRNIGFGKEGTHTKDGASEHADLATNSLGFPLVHPESISVNKEADRYTQFKHFQKPLRKKIYRKFKKLLWKMNNKGKSIYESIK